MGCIVSAQAEPQGVVPRRQSTKKNVVQPHGDASAGSGSPSPSDAKLLEEYSRSEAVTTKLADLLTHRASKGQVQDYYSIAGGNIGSGAFAVVRQGKHLASGRKACEISCRPESQSHRVGRTLLLTRDRGLRSQVAIKSITLQPVTRESVTRAVRKSWTSSPGASENDFANSFAVANKENGSFIVKGNGNSQQLGSNRPGAANYPVATTSRRNSSNHGVSGISPSLMRTPSARDVEKQLSSQMELLQICREIDLLANIKHPCVVELHEYFVCNFGARIHIILELLEGGDLKEYLHSRERDRFLEEEAKMVTRRVISGLSYIHSLDCVHRDLKLENILLKESGKLGTAKIADFGFARCMQRANAPPSGNGNGAKPAASSANEMDHPRNASSMDNDDDLHMRETCMSVCGTPHYMAPEVIGLQHFVQEPVKVTAVEGYSTPADMWSYGVMLYRMMSGANPFHGRTQETLFREIANGAIDMDDPLWETISAEAKDLIKNLIVVDPKKRFTANQAEKHAWLRS